MRSLTFPALLSLLSIQPGCGPLGPEGAGGTAGSGGAAGAGATAGSGGAAGAAGATGGAGGGACVSPDDGNPCTEDTCVDGAPAHLPLDGAACDDGDACTLSETCQSGACVPGAAVMCGPGTSCVSGACLAPVCTGAVGLPQLPLVGLGSPHYRIAAADFDGDGSVDIAAASGDLSVAMNLGHGSFASPVEVAGAGMALLAAADLDGDGAPDLAGALKNGDGMGVLFNTGGGAFATPVTPIAVSGLSHLAFGDLDGDGSVDVVTRGDAGHQLHLNQGGGTFAAPISLPALQEAGHLTIADLDGDGAMDIAANTTGAVLVLLNEGAGTFAPPLVVSSAPHMNLQHITAGDVDGDGAPDLAISLAGGNEYTGGAGVLLNQGGGVYSMPVYFPVPCTVSPMFLADVDGDGKSDLVCGGVHGAGVAHGLAGGALGPQVTYVTGSPTPAVAPADVNGDGALDLLVLNQDGEDISVLRNPGDGDFSAAVDEYVPGTSVGWIQTADMDGDGHPDVVTRDFPDGVGVMKNLGDGALAAPVHFPVPQGSSPMITGDFDGDGRPDVLVGQVEPGGAVHALWNDGSGALSAAVEILATNVENASPSMVGEDLDGDGDRDLAVIGSASALVVSLNDGAGSFSTPVTFTQDFGYRELAAADFDGDGDLDLALTAPLQGVVIVVSNDGTGSFSDPIAHFVFEPYGTLAMPIVAADLDGDGDADLAFSSYEPGEVRVLLNDGSGGFGAPLVHEGLTRGLSLRAVDMNNDGALDLVVGCVTAGDSLGVLLNSGDGTFSGPQLHGQKHVFQPLTPAVHAISAADLDADGRIDLAVASDGVQVMRNVCLP